MITQLQVENFKSWQDNRSSYDPQNGSSNILMYVIVDTNRPVVANGRSSQASPQCAIDCVRRLREIQQGQILVLDDGWLIVKEYMKNFSSTGQPGVVLTNIGNPSALLACANYRNL